MRAIVVEGGRDESAMHVAEVEAPASNASSLRIRVVSAGVNRADLLQRQGLYPPPPGASSVLGLECAGEVVEIGADVEGWRVGDSAMALLAGGGYAEEVVVSAGSAMHVPECLPLLDAGGFPEVFLTVFLNVFHIGQLPAGGTLLVHGGGSGIGTAAIALSRAAGASCIVTAGSDEKCRLCLELGADAAVNYRSEDFVEAVADRTGGRGADIVLDCIGAEYLERNLRSLAVGGRLILIGLMGGAKAEINLGGLLTKRQQLIGSTLRARPDSEKAEIVSAFLDRFGSQLESGNIAPQIYRAFDLSEAGAAHRLMKASEHFGKLVLRVA